MTLEMCKFLLNINAIFAQISCILFWEMTGHLVFVFFFFFWGISFLCILDLDSESEMTSAFWGPLRYITWSFFPTLTTLRPQANGEVGFWNPTLKAFLSKERITNKATEWKYPALRGNFWVKARNCEILLLGWFFLPSFQKSCGIPASLSLFLLFWGKTKWKQQQQQKQTEARDWSPLWRLYTLLQGNSSIPTATWPKKISFKMYINQLASVKHQVLRSKVFCSVNCFNRPYGSSLHGKLRTQNFPSKGSFRRRAHWIKQWVICAHS